MHSRPDRRIAPLTLLAIVSALISGCSDSVLTGGEEDPSDNPTYETQVSGRCTFKIVRNVYDGPNWWGTITVSNRGSIALSAFTIAFDIPSGARCDYAETGWRHTQTGSTCRYSRPGMILKPGARIAVHYSTTSQGFSAATKIKLSDPACDVTAAAAGPC